VAGTAPEWVSYAALGVAGFAALIALSSARISYLSYRASGPRVRLQVDYRSRDAASARVVMGFTIVNEGRGDISIVGFYVTPYGSSKPVLPIEEIEGEPLPHRLAGNSQETWSANVLPAMRRYDAGLRDRSIRPWSSWPSQIYFSVKTGSGKYVHAKSAGFDSRALIADAFPG
jgi:hypothetical protein